jgi:hypothetical protein
MSRRAVAIALLSLVALGLLVTGVLWLVPRNGTALGRADQAQLLRQAGLPTDFPIHPGARRMPQAPQGGVSYALTVPVPDAASWLSGSLTRAGYEVFSGDIPGDDEFMTRWFYFHRAANQPAHDPQRPADGHVTPSAGAAVPAEASGAIIVRELRQSWLGISTATEVKILSRSDARLRSAAIAGGALAPRLP